MNNNLAKIDQFKGVLNSQTIRAQLKNSLKDKAGQFMSSTPISARSMMSAVPP